MSKKKHKKKSKPPQKNKPIQAEFSLLDSVLPFWDKYISKYLSLVLIGITTAIMAWWSWGTWCDPMIDFGRELYIPWQLTESKTLYTDIAYFNGPLSPYFNALWFSLLGVHLRSILFINFLILTLILFFSYQLLKEIGSRTGATLGCLVIVTVFAFAKYHFIGGYNFIAPYSHEMLHGLLLSIIGIWCLSKYLHLSKNYFLLLFGTSLGLIFLTKVEFTIAAAISFFSGFSLILWLEKKHGNPIGFKPVLFLTGAIIPPFVSFLLLYTRMPVPEAIVGTLGSWIGALTPELREMIFYQQLMGVDNLGMNIKIMLVSFGCLALLFVPAVLFSSIRQINKKQEVVIGLTFLAGIILTSALFINTLLSLGPLMLRLLPLVLLSLIIIEGIHLQFQNRDNTQNAITVLRITILIFALLLLLKIILKADPSQYGFALAMPGTIIMVSALVDWLPTYFKQEGKAGAILRLFSVGIIIIFSGTHLLVSGFWYSKTNVEIKTDTAKFYSDFRGNIINDIIIEIENHISPQETLAVLPEGVMLNFLTQRKNPTPYINFMPPEFALFGESDMLKSFQTNPPDYIVQTNKSLEEYGLKEVGIDIGVDLYQWINKNYILIKQLEHESESNLPFAHMRLLSRIRPMNSNDLKPSQ